MTRYAVTVTIDVSSEADDHLQTPQAIEAEVRSWLEGLGAVVTTITVEEQP